MNKKTKIDAIFVVEGKTDKDKLLSLFDTEIITTNGSALELEIINLINQSATNKKIILFLDPDYAGEKIRKQINDHLINKTNVYHCFVNKEDMEPKAKKIGIAEATNEAIYRAIENVICFKKDIKESMSWNDFLSFGIDNKQKRIFICNLLKISYCNNKQLFKRINMMSITADELEEMIDNA